MENVSKFLLIAAAVLIVILIITVGIKIIGSSSEIVSQSEGLGSSINDNIKIGVESIEKSLGNEIFDSSFEWDGRKIKKYIGNNSNVTIPSNATSIMDNAFENTDIKSVILSENVESIGNYAFKECKSLEKFVIPGSLKYIGAFAFENCKKLTRLEYTDKNKSFFSDINKDNMWNVNSKISMIITPYASIAIESYELVNY